MFLSLTTFLDSEYWSRHGCDSFPTGPEVNVPDTNDGEDEGNNNVARVDDDEGERETSYFLV